ncbi:MAG: pyridoxamine 5'-phosphate oxidase family protein [Erythrobacter sp.]|nr:pyridoxamine 5'-phosphate oxidase family protein [Erythrobacter sp.]
MTNLNTFHSGELAAQKQAGAGDVASWAADFIRDHMPGQHRDFYGALPFLVVAAEGPSGRPWVSILEGQKGFATPPDPRTLELRTRLHPSDPLASSIASGTDIGVLGIELATKRRNRLSGFIQADRDGQLRIDIRQTFGNCPQFIRERNWHRVSDNVPANAVTSQELSAEQMMRIAKSDTMFIGSGHRGEPDAPSSGYDASHRGGEPGFIQVVDAKRLRIPDYSGNNFFNTIGNLMENPQIGLLFIDFETGGLLHISGSATIDWEPENPHDPAARRMIDVTVEEVVDRPRALTLRWSSDSATGRQLRVAKKVMETPEIVSLYLRPDDELPLEEFEAGQHLPIEFSIPDQDEKVRRSYSLSGPPKGDFYRLSVKREELGIASRHIHDTLKVGQFISTARPAGDFILPQGETPLVLVSAGVGLTPMLSMLHAIVQQQSDRSVWFVHGARDGRHHGFRDEVDSLVASRPNIRRAIHYSNPLESDRKGRDFDFTGRITPASLIELDAPADAHYLLCGPATFLSQIQSGLIDRGVPDHHIHHEMFGPGS